MESQSEIQKSQVLKNRPLGESNCFAPIWEQKAQQEVKQEKWTPKGRLWEKSGFAEAKPCRQRLLAMSGGKKRGK